MPTAMHLQIGHCHNELSGCGYGVLMMLMVIIYASYPDHQSYANTGAESDLDRAASLITNPHRVGNNTYTPHQGPEVGVNAIGPWGHVCTDFLHILQRNIFSRY